MVLCTFVNCFPPGGSSSHQFLKVCSLLQSYWEKLAQVIKKSKTGTNDKFQSSGDNSTVSHLYDVITACCFNSRK